MEPLTQQDLISFKDELLDQMTKSYVSATAHTSPHIFEINEGIKGINNRLDRMNGTVAEHEKRIIEKEIEDAERDVKMNLLWKAFVGIGSAVGLTIVSAVMYLILK